MKKIFLFLFSTSVLFAWWSAPQNLGILGSDDINPHACRQASSKTCLVWQSRLFGNWDILSRFFDDYANVWGDSAVVTTDAATDANPNVASDYWRDCFWCVWQNNSSRNWDIYVSQSDENTWSMPDQLTTASSEDELPSVYVNKDTVWVVWQKMLDDSMNIYSAFYDGISWSTPIPVSFDSGVCNTRPRIHGRYTHPFVVWESDSDIYYSEYINGAWQTPQPITDDTNDDCNPELMSRSFSFSPQTYGVWVVWQSNRDGNYEIYTTAYDTLNIFYRMTFNDSTDITPSSLHYTALFQQDNIGPPTTALSTNRNGDYDIYTYFNGWSDTLIPVDTDQSEDILPTMTRIYDDIHSRIYLWVLWQTDRNFYWDIYGSYICWQVAVEETNEFDKAREENIIVTPNPFRQNTKINLYLLQKPNDFKMKIYDATGRMVKEFDLSTIQPLPVNQISWDGTDSKGQRLSEGIYFVHLKTQAEIIIQKVVLLQ